MKIIVLYENTKQDEKLLAGHGLSIYIETYNKKILLDTGQDGSFMENAKYLGVDIEEIDIAVISHFHYDHAGGLKCFLEKNKKAKVYVGKSFFGKYFASNNDSMTSFGLNIENYYMDRFIFVDDEFEISNNIKIISKLNYQFDNPLNEKFYKKVGDELKKDDFSHEIALLIEEYDSVALFSGCFHSGAINSIDRAKEVGANITHIIGGFHLEGSSGLKVSEDYINMLSYHLTNNDIIGYTGHCTGINSFSELKKDNKKNMYYIFTGSEYEI